MAGTSLPTISVEFKKKASTVVKRGSHGVIALVLRDTTNQGVFTVTGAYDIPSNLSAANKKYINASLIGNVNAPNKIVCCVIGAEADINTALELLELEEFNYVVVPTMKQEEKAKVKTFVEKMRNDIKYKVKAVMNDPANAEYIINSSADNVETKDFETLNKDEFCCQVASIIAGTPLNQSVTSVSPKGVVKIPNITRSQAESKVKSGELVLMKEMGKIRIARGVNSLTSTTEAKTEEFKKIKLIDTMDLIHNDIRQTCIESYIGKMANSYDNKCKLIVGISSYFDVLAKDELIENDYVVEIDLNAQKAYLKEKGVDISSMSEQEIKQANTGDKVFIKAVITLIDAMEEIQIQVEV